MQGEDIRALMYRLIIRDSVRLRQSQLLDWKNSPASREGMSTNLSDTYQFLEAAWIPGLRATKVVGWILCRTLHRHRRSDSV